MHFGLSIVTLFSSISNNSAFQQEIKKRSQEGLTNGHVNGTFDMLY